MLKVILINYYSLDSIAFASGTKTSYQGELTTQSSMFARPNGYGNQYYFEAIEMTVPMSGTYVIVMDNNIDIYGCLYSKSFNRNSPTLNLIRTSHDSHSASDFNFQVNMTASQSIVVVVTTYEILQTARFNITVYGPDEASFKGKLQC